MTDFDTLRGVCSDIVTRKEYEWVLRHLFTLPEWERLPLFGITVHWRKDPHTTGDLRIVEFDHIGGHLLTASYNAGRLTQ